MRRIARSLSIIVVAVSAAANIHCTDPASYTDRASIQPDVLDMQEIVRVMFTGVF